MTAQGSCLCGAVRYEVDGSLGDVRYCHCRSCRKLTGTAFTANARIPASAFRLLAGADSLSEYRTARGPRMFCSICGSPVFAQGDEEPDWVRVRLGGLEGELDVRITAHVWVSSKGSWFEITDTLPQYPEAAPPSGGGRRG